MSNEEFYDAHIAPMLLNAARLCEERGLPMFATVEYEADSWGDTQVRLAKSDTMTMTALARKSRGNIDGLALLWARFAKDNDRNHNSIVLAQMGI